MQGLRPKREEEAQKEAFKERIESRKENVINYEVGQVLEGIVVKVIRFCLCWPRESDGFIKTEDLSIKNIDQAQAQGWMQNYQHWFKTTQYRLDTCCKQNQGWNQFKNKAQANCKS